MNDFQAQLKAILSRSKFSLPKPRKDKLFDASKPRIDTKALYESDHPGWNIEENKPYELPKYDLPLDSWRNPYRKEPHRLVRRKIWGSSIS